MPQPQLALEHPLCGFIALAHAPEHLVKLVLFVYLSIPPPLEVAIILFSNVCKPGSK